MKRGTKIAEMWVGFPGGQLDEESWPAANVAGITGAFVGASVWDYTSDILYHDLPFDTPMGHEVAGLAHYTVGGVCTVRETVEFIDPDHQVKGRRVDTYLCDEEPGWEYVAHTEHIILNKKGLWLLHAVLELV